MSHLTPEERKRIAEEQRIRNQENLSMSLKYLPRIFLIVGGVIVTFFLCMVLSGFGLLSSILSALGG